MQSLRSCRTVAAVLSLLLVWLCCLQRAAAQTGTGGTTTNRAPISHTIRGKVFLPSGHPPDMRVRVVLEANTGGIAGETFTDSVGNFEFRSVSNNNYRVTAHTDQRTFETTQEQLEVSGSFSRTFNVQIYLREKDAERAILKDKLLSVADTQEAPKNARKLYEKALKLARDDKHQDALAPLKEALQLFPDYLLALNKLGEEHARLEQLTEEEWAALATPILEQITLDNRVWFADAAATFHCHYATLPQVIPAISRPLRMIEPGSEDTLAALAIVHEPVCRIVCGHP